MRNEHWIIAICAAFILGFLSAPKKNEYSVDTGLEERLLRDAENARKRADSLLVMDARKNEQIRKLEIQLIKNEDFINNATATELDSLFTIYLRCYYLHPQGESNRMCTVFNGCACKGQLNRKTSGEERDTSGGNREPCRR